MKKSANGQKKSTCWQILPPHIFRQLKWPLSLVTNISWHTSYELLPILTGRLKRSMRLYDISWFLIIGGHIISETQRVMPSFPTHLRGLGLKIFAETSKIPYKDSKRIMSNLQVQILGSNNNEGKTRGEYDGSWQQRMKKQKKWWKLLIKKGFELL